MANGMTRADVMTWSGRTIIDEKGRRVGKIKDIYYDNRTGEAEWGLVQQGRLLKDEKIVPLAALETVDQKTMRVPFPREEVKAAPPVQVQGSLSADEKTALYRHYHMREGEPVTGQPSETWH